MVNATIDPAVIAGARPPPSVPLFTHPATRYTRAGVIEKKICTTAKNERPIIC